MPRLESVSLAALLLAAAVPACAAELWVGAGERYAWPSEALAAARDGDVVYVKAGVYENDFAVVRARVTMVGVGGMAHLKATMPPPNGKAILVVKNDVTLRHIELSGAAVRDRNGAGIRYEGGHLTISNCYFHHNQNGILAADAPTGTISVSKSEFASNGNAASHAIYANRLAKITVSDSWIHDTVTGHHIKSRARETIIENNMLDDGQGTASYSIDLPNGGLARIKSNTLIQGSRGENGTIIAIGAEGRTQPDSAFLIEDNTFANSRSNAIGVKNFTGTVAQILNNRVYDLAVIADGPNRIGGTELLRAPPTVTDRPPWDADHMIDPRPN